MFISARVSLLLIAVLAFSPETVVTAAEGKTEKPTELKELDRLVGEWTSETTVTVLAGEAKNLRTTGTVVRQWALDGYIVEETGKSSDGGEARVLFTYDRTKRGYRWFFFNNHGAIVDHLGAWDPEQKSFTFKTNVGNGLTQTSTIHFTDADHHEWTAKVTDVSGKVQFNGSGKLTRKK